MDWINNMTKVKDLIEQLNRDLKPDDQIIVAYWDKETVEQYAEVTLTDDQWTDIVAEQSAHESIELENYGATLQDIASEVGQSIYDEPED
jgi:hypothetical protein